MIAAICIVVGALVLCVAWGEVWERHYRITVSPDGVHNQFWRTVTGQAVIVVAAGVVLGVMAV